MQIEKSWYQALAAELQKDYMQQLKRFIASERANGAVYPPDNEVFRAFYYTPIDQVKVVIVGQDPYHGRGQAHGLSFSVKEGVAIPPSLRNIYKEMATDVGLVPPNHGNLVEWARQGVLLLNATLTVREGSPGSHFSKGWEQFTDRVIERIALLDQPVVFMLWGRNARLKAERVLNHVGTKKVAVLKAAHPSPLSAHNGFFGCRHFSKANQFLTQWGRGAVDWSAISQSNCIRAGV
ncbi:MAG: Uracil-DNA glycosylase [Chlamydiia bacterium]|nr:Uracil-DNA glycosylase [Chlamydiia bacterium]